MDKIDELKQKLSIFRPAEPSSIRPLWNLITCIHDPPSYIVQYLLFGIGSFGYYGRSDKVWWQTYFTYKDRIFKVRDYKFGSWIIEGEDDTEESKRVALEVKARISKACETLDDLLSRELKEKVENGDYYINNAYHKLREIFIFYMKKTQEAIKEHESALKKLESMEPPEDPKPPEIDGKGIMISRDKPLENYLNEVYRLETVPLKVITHYSLAMITSFYSLTEFLLEAMYAFEQSKKPRDEFAELRWNEKFKLLFPINAKRELGKFYNSFVEIKRDYRNPLTHGLADEEGRLVWLDFAGLVPVSYKYLSTKLHYDGVLIRKDDALSLIDTFTRFLDFIENNEPYGYYMLYLSYGFPIPMNPERIAKYRAQMTSYENFQDYMERQAMQHDAYMNREDYPW